MNWVRKSVLASHQARQQSEINRLKSDFSALERRVTELEAKIFRLASVPPLRTPGRAVASMSPLGEFQPKGTATTPIVPAVVTQWVKTPEAPKEYPLGKLFGSL